LPRYLEFLEDIKTGKTNKSQLISLGLRTPLIMMGFLEHMITDEDNTELQEVIDKIR